MAESILSWVNFIFVQFIVCAIQFFGFRALFATNYPVWVISTLVALIAILPVALLDASWWRFVTAVIAFMAVCFDMIAEDRRNHYHD